jgi:thiamine-phosphate pyrophosphorylase
MSSFLTACKRNKKIADKYKVPYVINDNVDIAIACGADGVHVGQKDMDAKDVRKIIGPDKILGVSAQTVEQAILQKKWS